MPLMLELSVLLMVCCVVNDRDDNEEEEEEEEADATDDHSKQSNGLSRFCRIANLPIARNGKASSPRRTSEEVEPP